jgi:trimeric autotransporter adhesin
VTAGSFTRHLAGVRRGTRIFYSIGLAAAAAIMVLALNAVYGFLNTSAASSAAQRTATVALGTVQSSVTASGNVSAASSASVGFGASGTVTAVNIAVGDRVKAGQVLGKIDPATAQTTLEAANANLAQAQSALTTAQGGLTAAQKASNASSLLQAQSSIPAARQQLSGDIVAVTAAKTQLGTDVVAVTAAKTQLGTDVGAVTTAQTQLARDQALACPPAGTTSSSSSGSGAASASSSSTGAAATATPAKAAATPAKAAATAIPAKAAATPLKKALDARLVAATAAAAPAAPAGPSLPTVATGQGSSVGSATATLSGTVNPSGADTTYHFEYGTSASSLSSSAAALDAGTGAADVSVTANLTGLQPGLTYYFRLVATNALGTVDGGQVTFVTLAAAAPTVTSASASNLLTTTATLNGSINPNGADTTYRFEYGTTAAYGSKTATVDAGSGTAAVQVSASLTGLKPDTAYLFRLVATNSSGTGDGIGQIAKTAQTSCAADASTITSAEQTVAQQRTTITSAEQTVAQQRTAITSAEQTVAQQRTAITSAVLGLAQTKATIAASVKPPAATIAQAVVAVKQAQATVAADQKALAGTTLTAPLSGTVTALNGSVGTTVSGSGSSVSRGAASAAAGSTAAGSGAGSSSSSSPFATIDSLNKLEIVSGFAEADATKLAVGQPAVITFPALTTTQVAGSVVSVASTSTVVSNVVTYAVTIVLINPPSAVKEGMTANVNVVTKTRSQVLQLPTSAITTTGPASTVELLSNGKTTVTRVTTGLVGSSSTEIVSGVKNGDLVVIPTVAIAAATASTGTAGTLGGGGFGGGFGGGGGGFTRPGG